MITEALLREAWLRAEAQCECRHASCGHGPRCGQFLIWEDRGGTDKGAWEVREHADQRPRPCDILCSACYVKVTGMMPKGPW